MPSLQVRELPEYLYRKLQIAAQKEHRSFSQQAVMIIILDSSAGAGKPGICEL